MDWNQVIILLAGLIILLGVTMIFDARSLAKTLFGFGDQNEASMGMKMFGFILSMVGAFLFFFKF